MSFRFGVEGARIACTIAIAAMPLSCGRSTASSPFARAWQGVLAWAEPRCTGAPARDVERFCDSLREAEVLKGIAVEHKALLPLARGSLYIAKLGVVSVLAYLDGDDRVLDARFFLAGSASPYVVSAGGFGSALFVNRWHAGTGLNSAQAYSVRVDGSRLVVDELPEKRARRALELLVDSDFGGDALNPAESR